MINKQFEIRVVIPDDCRLIGCKTENDVVVVVFEAAGRPGVRSIGYCREHSGVIEDEDEGDLGHMGVRV